MVTEYFSDEQVYQVFGIDIGLARDQVALLG
jgi:hypothetical protein